MTKIEELREEIAELRAEVGRLKEIIEDVCRVLEGDDLQVLAAAIRADVSQRNAVISDHSFGASRSGGRGPKGHWVRGRAPSGWKARTMMGKGIKP